MIVVFLSLNVYVCQKELHLIYSNVVWWIWTFHNKAGGKKNLVFSHARLLLKNNGLKGFTSGFSALHLKPFKISFRDSFFEIKYGKFPGKVLNVFSFLGWNWSETPDCNFFAATLWQKTKWRHLADGAGLQEPNTDAMSTIPVCWWKYPGCKSWLKYNIRLAHWKQMYEAAPQQMVNFI